MSPAHYKYRLESAFIATLFGGLLLAQPLRAYDPATVWRTVVSPNFRVHHPEHLAEQAQAVAQAGETALAQLTVRLGWTPKSPIPIVINADTDMANGFAQNYPYNLVGLNAVAPEEVSELSDYDDWIYTVVAHELAHIVHIDTIVGLPRIINYLFGRLLVPNSVQPTWLVEGVAVYFESALTSAGRVRSPYADMFLRTAILAGEPMTLDEISGVPKKFPQGTAAYLYGGRFTDFLVERFGEDILRQISFDYGGRLIPFAVNAGIKAATGFTYPELYAEFIESLTARYNSDKKAIDALGENSGQLLTRRGQYFGPGRVQADGSVYFVESGVGSHTALKVLRSDGREQEVTWVESGAEVALAPNGRQVLIAQPEIFSTYNAFYDLFLLDLDTGSVSQQTFGQRLHGPDISASGNEAVFVKNVGFNSQIYIAPMTDLGSARMLFEFGPSTQVWQPRFSPDGQAIVFVGFKNGQRDIFSYDRTTGAINNLTVDKAVDGGAVFSVDGKWILFHSDRDGIFNLYAVPVGGGQIRRLTRVLTGAFQPEPTPDGTAVIYRSFGLQGFDLAYLKLPDLETAPLGGLARQVVAKPSEKGSEIYAIEPYSSLSTVWPRSWLPASGVDTRGDTLGASITGTDAVGLHAASISAWYGLASAFTGFAASYSNRQFHPGLGLDISRNLGFAAVPYIRNRRPQGVEEQVWAGKLSTNWPLLSRRRANLWLHTSYNLEIRRSSNRIRFEPFDLAPVFPDQGRFAAVVFGVGFSNAQRYLESISSESGGNIELRLRLEDPYLGSEYSSVSGILSASQYFENPIWERQVLAMSLSAGYGRSSYQNRALFAIGGLPKRDILLDILNYNLGFGDALRGFPLAPYAGDAMLVGHLEYRAPIIDIERGVSTLPFFARTLHMAVFLDGAALSPKPAGLREQAHLSWGGELRLDLFLGYAIPVMVRLGYGRGIGKDSDLQNVFIVTGNTF